MSTIVSTGFILPQSVIANGQATSNPFLNPNNILLADNLFAQGDSTADITVGNFQFNIPSDAVITGIEFKVKGKRGEQIVPPVTLTFYAVDNTSGTDIFYPYISVFTGLTPTNTVHSFGTSNYTFATAFTADQANNLKLQIVSDGQVFLDDVLMNVYYYVPSSITPIDPDVSGCADCNSPIQVQAMYLELPFLIGEDEFYLKAGSWQYPDGTPVQPGDVGSCGGEVVFVFDEGKPKADGQNFEENVVLNISTGNWMVLPSGVIKFDIGSVTNRARQFHTPYAHDATLMSDHNANSKVIVSNSALFYSRFIRRCEVDITFSPPIAVLDEGATVTPSVHSMNFTGAGVNVIVPDPLNPDDVEIIIPGTGVSTPVPVDTVTGTSGDVQVLTLDLDDLSVEGVNRGVLVQISTEELATVSSVVGNGSENFIQVAVDTDVANNIRSEIWLLVAPTAGLMDIVITLSQAAYISAGAESFTSVDQSNPTDTVATDTGNSNAPTVTNVTTNDGSLVVDCLATAVLPILYTAGLNQVENWHQTANPIVRQGGSSYQIAGTAPDNVIMSWALTQVTDWVITSVELNGIPAVTPVVSPLTVESQDASPSVPNTVKIVVPEGHVTSPMAGQADISFQNVMEIISQTAHGFSVSEVIQSSGTDGEYQLSQADSAVNSEVVGIVAFVEDANTFNIVTEGYVIVTLPGGAVTGDILYLSDSVAGELTLTAPSAAGTIIHKLGQVIDDSTGLIYFHNYLGLTQAQSTGSNFDPSSNGFVYDDFVSNPAPSSTLTEPCSLLNWSISSGDTLTFVLGETNHPGIADLVGTMGLFAPGTTDFPVGDFARSGNTYNFIVRNPSNDTSITEIIMGDLQVGGGIQDDTILIEFNTTTLTYRFQTRDTVSTETTNLGAYLDTDWLNISVVCLGTSVELYVGVNGAAPALLATHSTNIPATNVGGNVGFNTNTTEILSIDYFSMSLANLVR